MHDMRIGRGPLVGQMAAGAASDRLTMGQAPQLPAPPSVGRMDRGRAAGYATRPGKSLRNPLGPAWALRGPQDHIASTHNGCKPRLAAMLASQRVNTLMVCTLKSSPNVAFYT